MTTTTQSVDALVPAIQAAELALTDARSAAEYTSASDRMLAGRHDAVAVLYHEVVSAAADDTFAYHAALWLYSQHRVDADRLRANADLRDAEMSALRAGGR